MDDNSKMLWGYYKKAAEAVGVKDHTKNPPEEHGYSLWSKFYNLFDENNLEKDLNPVTKAFLGIKEAPLCDDDAKIRIEKDKEDIKSIFSGRDKAPNPSQIAAIAAAFNNTVSIIEGPPGTGKTETICNLLRMLLHKNKDVTIAVVSSNNEAVRNIIDNIEDLKGNYAELGSIAKREAFFVTENLKDDYVNSKKGKKRFRYYPKLLKSRNIIFSTIHSLNDCIITEGSEKVFQYDYVIIDECSQVSNMLGLVAMAAARHLVLFGDTKQLPPVNSIKKAENDKTVEELKECANDLENAEVSRLYLDKNDNSFMKSCGKIFCDESSGKPAKMLLNEHYRCHPGIIGFCNREFYEGQLEIKTKDDGILPIRIRYYNGNYYERIHADHSSEDSDSYKNRIYNKKQISIFMKEEYPGLVEKLKTDSNLGVCIISPYRYQLELLAEKIKAYNKKHNIKNDEVEIEYTEEQTEDSDSVPVNKVPCLTVHKVQGRGYDIVYYLPVQEGLYSKKKWSQGNEIFNVTVSRAKKELCVICASDFLPEEITGSKRYDDECNLSKLSDYVLSHPSYEKSAGKGYGFIKSEIKSVFDNDPGIPANPEGYIFRYESKEDVRLFSPEIKMARALYNDPEITDRYDIYIQVPVKKVDLSGISFDKAESVFIENDSHFDIVFCKKGQDKIVLITEIDGQFHRMKETKDDKDNLKETIVDKAGIEIIDFMDPINVVPITEKTESSGSTKFTRIPTDGTTCDEVQRIKAILKNAAGDHRLIAGSPASFWTAGDICSSFAEVRKRFETRNKNRKDIINDFQNDLRALHGYLKSECSRNKWEIQKAVNRVNGGKYNYGNQYDLKYYLLKYGIAYLFDYSVIYRLIINNMTGKNDLSIASIGCGSGIDHKSLEYALQVTDFIRDFSWKGYDPAGEWVQVQGKKWFSDGKVFKMSAQEYFAQDHIVENVIIFPRSFGDIVENSAYNDMIKAAEKQVFTNNELFLCIAHVNVYEKTADYYKTAEHYEKAIDFIERLSKTFRDQGFEKKEMVYSGIPMLCSQESEEPFPGYLAFADQEVRISNIDEFFTDKLIDENKKWVNEINMIATGNIQYPITTVRFSNYQILHFVRKQK